MTWSTFVLDSFQEEILLRGNTPNLPRPATTWCPVQRLLQILQQSHLGSSEGEDVEDEVKGGGLEEAEAILAATWLAVLADLANFWLSYLWMPLSATQSKPTNQWFGDGNFLRFRLVKHQIRPTPFGRPTFVGWKAAKQISGEIRGKTESDGPGVAEKLAAMRSCLEVMKFRLQRLNMRNHVQRKPTDTVILKYHDMTYLISKNGLERLHVPYGLQILWQLSPS